MKQEYKLLGLLAIVLLVILGVGSTGAFSAMTVVSGDTETSLPIVWQHNIENGYSAETDQYTGPFTYNGAWTYGKFKPGEDGIITYSNNVDPFQEINRESGNMEIELAYADVYEAEGPGVIYLQMMRDSGAKESYFVYLMDYDGSSHTKTLPLNNPLSYYDTNGDGIVMFNVVHRAADKNYINIYGARMIISLASAVDSCDGVSCPDKCVGTTRYTNGICVDGACEYTRTSNSVQCGYDACDGVDCSDKCDGTTRLYGSTCIDGACTPYSRMEESATCGWQESDPECDPYCDDINHIKYYNGEYVDGACEYSTIEDSTECGFTTDPVDPTDPESDDTMILIGSLMGGAVIMLSLVFIGLRMRK